MNRRSLFGKIAAAAVAVAVAPAVKVAEAAPPQVQWRDATNERVLLSIEQAIPVSDPVPYAPPGMIVMGSGTRISGAVVTAEQGLHIPYGTRDIGITDCFIESKAVGVTLGNTPCGYSEAAVELGPAAANEYGLMLGNTHEVVSHLQIVSNRMKGV